MNANVNDNIGNLEEYEARVCPDCSESWWLSRGEKEFFASRGLQNPRRCKSGRAARRAQPERW